ncbi:MAG: hypothetical protein ABJF23_08280 [Bryobacteraceae bacterium]
MVILKRTLVFALAACSAFAADSSLLSLLSPDAKVVAGIYVDRSTASQFGQFMLRRMQREDAALNKFVTATGFDPRRDLTEVIVSSADAQNTGHGLVVAHGTFDIVRLAAQAKLSGGFLTNYKDVQVISGKSDGWIAFLDSRTVAAGDAALVRAAVDRRGSAVGIDPKLAAKVSEVSGKYDAWMVSIAPLSKFSGKLPDPRMNGMINGEMVQGIEQASGGVQFGASVQISGEAVTRSEKDATALADVVRFLAGMVQMNREKPEMAKFASVLDTMSLKSSANTLSISLSVPESDLEQMLKQPSGNRPVRRAAIQRSVN